MRSLIGAIIHGIGTGHSALQNVASVDMATKGTASIV